MDILVTGADGQLGRELRALAPASAHRYCFTDVADLDITDMPGITTFLSGRKVDVIVNCAAYTNVERAEEEQDKADKINHVAVANLAKAAKLHDAVLIHVSTDYVFGGEACVPYRPDSPTAPSSVYGTTKLRGEQAIREEGCKSIILRTAWLYSRHGKNFVKTMCQLTAEKDSLKVVYDQVGTPTCASDLATAIFRIIEENKLSACGTYHYTNEGVCSWYDFAVEICRMEGNRCSISPCLSDEFPSKVKRPHYSVLDKSSFKSTFGLPIPYWKDSLAGCLESMKKNER